MLRDWTRTSGENFDDTTDAGDIHAFAKPKRNNENERRATNRKIKN